MSKDLRQLLVLVCLSERADIVPENGYANGVLSAGPTIVINVEVGKSRTL